LKASSSLAAWRTTAYSKTVASIASQLFPHALGSLPARYTSGMKEFYAEIDDHIKEYEHGTITISEDIDFSMRQTVRQITHYIMSK
jgi:hypothetical protein